MRTENNKTQYANLILVINIILFNNINSMEQYKNIQENININPIITYIPDIPNEIISKIIEITIKTHINSWNIFNWSIGEKLLIKDLKNIMLTCKMFNYLAKRSIKILKTKKINLQIKEIKLEIENIYKTLDHEILNKQLLDKLEIISEIINDNNKAEDCEKQIKQAIKLIIAGADINIINNRGFYTLMAAIIYNYKFIVQLFIDWGSKFDAKDKNGMTPMMLTCKYNHLDIAKLLISLGANINIQNNNGNTALAIAANNNHIDMVKILLNSNNIIFKDTQNSDALLFSVMNKNFDIAKILIEAGADINVKSRYHNTPLSLAIYNDYENIVKLLLDHGANIDKSAIIAAKQGHINIMKLLIKYKVDINIKDEWGNTPLIYAILKNNKNMEKLLLDNGADNNIIPRFEQ